MAKKNRRQRQSELQLKRLEARVALQETKLALKEQARQDRVELKEYNAATKRLKFTLPTEVDAADASGRVFLLKSIPYILGAAIVAFVFMGRKRGKKV